MKKNNVLNKILCVFKPKKTPSDILTEAENIINQYISNDIDFIHSDCTGRKKSRVVNTLIILILGGVILFALKSLV